MELYPAGSMFAACRPCAPCADAQQALCLGTRFLVRISFYMRIWCGSKLVVSLQTAAHACKQNPWLWLDACYTAELVLSHTAARYHRPALRSWCSHGGHCVQCCNAVSKGTTAELYSTTQAQRHSEVLTLLLGLVFNMGQSMQQKNRF